CAIGDYARLAGMTTKRWRACASCDEVDRAGPGLVAVALHHADVDREVGAPGESHAVIDREAPIPVGFRKTIDAEPAAKPAAVEGDDIVAKPGEIDSSGNDVGLDLQGAVVRLVEPQIDAREVPGGHRIPGERGAGRNFHHLAFRIEKVDRGEAREA